MANSKLPTRDVLKLIAACNKNGVTKFKLGDLEINLERANKLAQESQVPTATIPENIPQNTQLSFPESAESRLEQEKEDIAMMLIEDPLEMESRIARGELVDEVTEH